MIGYPSGQDGAILPARDTGFVLQVYRSCFGVVFPYNKSFIDQACSVKMAGYWPHSFFACLWTSTLSQSINKHAKKELGQYPAILTSCLVNNPCVFVLQRTGYTGLPCSPTADQSVSWISCTNSIPLCILMSRIPHKKYLRKFTHMDITIWHVG